MVIIKSVLTAFLCDDLLPFHFLKKSHLQSPVFCGTKTPKKKIWHEYHGINQLVLRKCSFVLQDFQIYSDALVGKLSWRLVHNPQGLLGRFLLGRHSLDCNLLTCQDHTTSSHGWKNILVGRDFLVNNVGWLVRNRQTIKLWSDPWIDLNHQTSLMGSAN